MGEEEEKGTEGDRGEEKPLSGEWFNNTNNLEMTFALLFRSFPCQCSGPSCLLVLRHSSLIFIMLQNMKVCGQEAFPPPKRV